MVHIKIKLKKASFTLIPTPKLKQYTRFVYLNDEKN